MTLNTIKEYYTSTELAKLNLKSIPSTAKNIIEKARRESWVFRKRCCRGGGVEYAFISLPIQTQYELHDRYKKDLPQQVLSAVLHRAKKTKLVKSHELHELNAKQRDIADSRMALVAYVAQLEQVYSRIQAIQLVCQQAKQRTLPDEILTLVDKANARKGKRPGLSVRSLNGWICDYYKCNTMEERLKALAPKQVQPVAIENIPWLSDFMYCYRQTNGISISEAYLHFKQQCVKYCAKVYQGSGELWSKNGPPRLL